MDQETKYNETVQEFEDKLGRKLKEEEKELLNSLFNRDSSKQ